VIAQVGSGRISV